MIHVGTAPISRELSQRSHAHDTDRFSNVALAYPQAQGLSAAGAGRFKRALTVIALALLTINRVKHAHTPSGQVAGLRGSAAGFVKPSIPERSGERPPEYSTTASMINTPNEELENQLELTKGTDEGFLHVNERHPHALRELSDMMNIKSGNVVVVGGARSLVDVSFVGKQGAAGLIQFDRSPRVVLQARFMIELIKNAPTHEAFQGVLKEVMYGGEDIKPSNGLKDSLARHKVENMDPEILRLFETYLENDPAIKKMVGNIDSSRGWEPLTPMGDGFEGTVFRSEDAFLKVKALAVKDRLATVLADLNDLDSTTDLYARAKLMGDGDAPSAIDVSNAYWRGFTGLSGNFCRFLKDVAADHDEVALIMTGNDGGSDPHASPFGRKDALKRADPQHGSWKYFGANVRDVVEEKMVPSCYRRELTDL